MGSVSITTGWVLAGNGLLQSVCIMGHFGWFTGTLWHGSISPDSFLCKSCDAATYKAPLPTPMSFDRLRNRYVCECVYFSMETTWKFKRARSHPQARLCKIYVERKSLISRSFFFSEQDDVKCTNSEVITIYRNCVSLKYGRLIGWLRMSLRGGGKVEDTTS